MTRGTESQKKDSQSVSSLLKLVVEKSLRTFLAALQLLKNIIEETLTSLHEMLPKDLPQPFIIKFRTIMLIKGHGPDFKLECRQATVVQFFSEINIDSS